ncbi:MAG TPA: aminotransferase class I/II-fold pyridoxal phosphate-dependent enzyme, partial [Rhodospirillaceae bacterium]|nr:aminotransferase class I/II-fold pyridoxal phosphate-dependent enzyme [Rhodospirillaceae bacterium]
REHRRVLAHMRKEGLGLDLFRHLVERISYRLLEKLSPSKLRLATAAAIEHHNAAIADFFLRQDLLREIRSVEIRRLFLWHFAEEIEHKEVVFKLLQRVSDSRLLRAAGLFASWATFLFYLAVGAMLLGLKTRAIFAGAFWRELVLHCGVRDGLLVVLVKESLRYLRADFHPRVETSRDLLGSALAELERLGVMGPRPRLISKMPVAFQKKMLPILNRVRSLRPVAPYFEAAIGEYDGAWVQNEGVRKLNFCTYSYLGLLRHPHIQEAARQAIERYGTGTHGVRLLGGNLELHDELEARIATFFNREAAITFSSGFMTNLAVISSLVGRGDHVLSDRLNHASIVDGCRLSGAEVVRFKHNDMLDLANRLGRLPEDARKLIVVDAVYSMDGNIAPIQELISLRDRHPNTLLMVDEAHSLGVLGPKGRGVEEHFDCVGQIDVLMGCLSKAVPAQGGYIAGTRDMITYLRFNARGFVYSAALSPAVAAAALAAFELIGREGAARRSRLMSNVRYFIQRLRNANFDIGNSASAIVPILLGSEVLAFDLARRCNLEGLYATPVTHPVVPKGAERLRMNVTCDHRRKDLDFAIKVLQRSRTAEIARAA